jgi:CheY-like chemotaxis protein
MAVILVVEDDVFLLQIMEMTIQDWGHHTLSASDVDEALFLLRSPQKIDVLFTDIYLKTEVLGGCELAHQANFAQNCACSTRQAISLPTK